MPTPAVTSKKKLIFQTFDSGIWMGTETFERYDRQAESEDRLADFGQNDLPFLARFKNYFTYITKNTFQFRRILKCYWTGKVYFALHRDIIFGYFAYWFNVHGQDQVGVRRRVPVRLARGVHLSTRQNKLKYQTFISVFRYLFTNLVSNSKLSKILEFGLAWFWYTREVSIPYAELYFFKHE